MTPITPINSNSKPYLLEIHAKPASEWDIVAAKNREDHLWTKNERRNDSLRITGCRNHSVRMLPNSLPLEYWYIDPEARYMPREVKTAARDGFFKLIESPYLVIGEDGKRELERLITARKVILRRLDKRLKKIGLTLEGIELTGLVKACDPEKPQAELFLHYEANRYIEKDWNAIMPFTWPEPNKSSRLVKYLATKLRHIKHVRHIKYRKEKILTTALRKIGAPKEFIASEFSLNYFEDLLQDYLGRSKEHTENPFKYSPQQKLKLLKVLMATMVDSVSSDNRTNYFRNVELLGTNIEAYSKQSNAKLAQYFSTLGLKRSASKHLVAEIRRAEHRVNLKRKQEPGNTMTPACSI